jgi:hypothetical protein
MLGACDDFFSRYRQLKRWPEKFDLLFGFTKMLAMHDVWMHDHECEWEGHKPLAKLASLWKTVLKKDDATLQIDAAFTRPGVVAMLQAFKADVEAIDEGCDYEGMYKFNFA